MCKGQIFWVRDKMLLLSTRMEFSVIFPKVKLTLLKLWKKSRKYHLLSEYLWDSEPLPFSDYEFRNDTTRLLISQWFPLK